MYDFTTILDRSNCGSSKWELMKSKCKDIKGIAPLSVADMEIQTAPEIKECLKKAIDDTVLGYSMATPTYKESIMNWMDRHYNFKFEAKDIVSTSSVVSAFFNAIRVLTEENSGVVIMPPVYPPFFAAAKSNHRTLVECPLIDNNGHYEINFELFDKLTQDPKNKTLLFCSPHNPVGRVWTLEEHKRLGEIIIKNDVLLLSDEIHMDILMPGYKHHVFETVLPELKERTITFTSTSKTFNLAGIALSNIIIPNEKLREKFVQGLQDAAAVPHQTLGFVATECAYNYCEDWYKELLNLIDKNQHTVHDFFKEKFPQIKAPLIEGTYLMWIDFRALNMSCEDLEKFLDDKAKLFVNPGYTFGKEGEGFARINLACPETTIRDALQRLEKALKEIL